MKTELNQEATSSAEQPLQDLDCCVEIDVCRNAERTWNLYLYVQGAYAEREGFDTRDAALAWAYSAVNAWLRQQREVDAQSQSWAADRASGVFGALLAVGKED